MPLNLYMDQDSHDRRVVAGLLAAGIDVVSTLDVHAERLSDHEQLEFAATSGRVMYTTNRADFARLHRDWMRAGRSHAGVVVRVRQRMSVGDQVRGLVRVCTEIDPAAATNLFVYLDDWVRD